MGVRYYTDPYGWWSSTNEDPLINLLDGVESQWLWIDECPYTDDYKHFCDVPDTHTFSKYINRLFDSRIVEGCAITDTHRFYCPEHPLTKGQATKLVLRGMGESAEGLYTDPPPADFFSDVRVTHTFYAEIRRLWELGVLEHTELYEPDSHITRGELAELIVKALENRGVDVTITGTTPFPDVQPGHPFYEYVQYLKEHQIVTGFEDGEFKPDLKVTRGEAAKFIANDNSMLDLIPAAAQEPSDQSNNECQFAPTLFPILSLITPAEDIDCHRIEFSARGEGNEQELFISNMGLNADIHVDVIDATNNIVIASGEGLGRDGGFILSWIYPHPGTYYVKFTNTNPFAQEGTYLTVSTTPLQNSGCFIYASNEFGNTDSQFFTIDLTIVPNLIQPLGVIQSEVNIQSTDVHPFSRQLYATGRFSSGNSQLYVVHPLTGELNLIGTIQDESGTAFQGVVGLSFQPNGILWGYAYEGSQTGIIQIDPATGIASVVQSMGFEKRGMAWPPDGSELWLSHYTKLYSYVLGGWLVLEYDLRDFVDLPADARIEALEFRPDGLLWISIHDGENDLNIYTFDVENGELLTTDSFSTEEFQNVTGLAWPDWCTEQFPAISIIEPEGGVVTVTGGTDSLTIPADVFDKRTIVSDLQVAIGENQPNNKLAAGHGVLFNAYQNGALLEDFTFTAPATLTINYSDSEVYSMIESSLYIGTWNGEQWSDAACGVYTHDLSINQISVPICHLGLFELFGDPVWEVYLPMIMR